MAHNAVLRNMLKKQIPLPMKRGVPDSFNLCTMNVTIFTQGFGWHSGPQKSV